MDVTVWGGRGELRQRSKRLKLLLSFYVVSVLLLSCFFIPFSPFTSTVRGAWWDTDFSHYVTIDIESDYIESTLTNFPILVVIPTAIGSKCDGGNSLRFLLTDNTTILNYEIDTWNASANSYVWVNVTSIASGSDTTILMYYNNTGASNGENITDTWDSNYVMVHHMNGAIDTDIDDSTIYNNDVTGDVGTPDYNQAGSIGYAVHLDGADKGHLAVGDSASLSIENEYTIEAVHRPKMDEFLQSTGATSNQAWIIYRRTGEDGYALMLYDESISAPHTQKGQIWAGDGAFDRCGYQLDTYWDENWNYFGGTFDEDDNTGIFYSNNTYNVTTGITENLGAGSDTLYIGSKSGNFFYDGDIDELRISDIERSVAWMNASYHFMNMTTGLITFGSEQTYVPPPNDPPWLQAYDPVNASVDIDPTGYTFNVTLADNESTMDITIYIYNYGISNFVSKSWNNVGNGSYTWLWTNGTYSQKGYWYVEVTDDNTTYEYPDTGYTVLGKNCWEFWYTNNSNPVISNLNLCGNTYTVEQWREAHTLTFDINDPEGDQFDLVMWIGNDFDSRYYVFDGHWGFDDIDFSFTRNFRWYPEWNETTNMSVSIDLEPYVHFKDMNYTLTFFAIDENHDDFVSGGSWSNCTFTIGNPANRLDYLIAVKDMTPPNMEYHAIDQVGEGITFDIMSNGTNPEGGDYMTAVIFICDHEGRVLQNHRQQIRWVEDVDDFKEQIWWNYHLFTEGHRPRLRHNYWVYIGFFYTYYNETNTQFSLLYDTSMVEPVKFRQYRAEDIAWHIVEDHNGSIGSYHFYGLKCHFATFPAGEDPEDELQGDYVDNRRGSDFNEQFDTTGQAIGIPWLGYIAGLLIIVVFSIMPTIAGRYYRKDMPILVNGAFFCVGVILAFAMGLFDIWVFIIITIIALMLIAYRIKAWIDSGRGVSADAGE